MDELLELLEEAFDCGYDHRSERMAPSWNKVKAELEEKLKAAVAKL